MTTTPPRLVDRRPYTPGPWSVRHFKVYGTPDSEVVSANGSRVPYCDADKRLIAAAPELLSALQAIIDRSTTKLPSNLWRQIHHAVDKATGGAA